MSKRNELTHRNRWRITQLSAAVVSSTALLATGAFAQEAAAPEGLEEIVVTAQKRQERLVDVPIAIAAVSGDALQEIGVTSVVNLPQAIPGLRFDYSGSFVQPTIRGVGSALAGPGQTSNVAVYLDGFYVPNALGTDFQLLSVEGVEVLKGPQGTLFGRNATGGAVLVKTRDPSFDPTFIARANYGSFNRTGINLYGSTGLTDRMAVDLAGFYEQGDGYVKNLNTGKDAAEFDKWSVRGKLLFQVTDEAKLTLGYGHSDIDDPSPGEASNYNGLSAGAVLGPILVPPNGVPVAGNERRRTSNGVNTKSTLNSDEVTLRGEFDLGYATLTSLSLYRDEDALLVYDYDGTALPVFSPSFKVLDKTYTQEFDLASKGDGRLSWVAGLYYYNNENTYPAFNVSVGGAPYTKFFDTKVESESFAGFLDLTYELADQWFLTVGGRYSRDKIDSAFQRTNLAVGAIDPSAVKTDETFSKFTPRAILRYAVDDNQSVYASYNQGYKAGVFNPSGFSTEPVDPEEINAYELGYKLAKTDYRFEASAFYYDYKDLQVASYIGTSAIINNAASSEVYGVDTSFTAQLSERFDLTLGAVWLHARYENYDTAVSYFQVLDPTSPAFALFANQTVDASDNDVARSPEITASIGLHYNQPLASGNLDLNANYYYTDKFYFDAVNQFGQDAYGLLNLRATWTTADEKWAYAVYGTNVTDEKYRTQVLPGTFAIQQTYGEPAAVGISVTYKY
ncbi:MAG: TonB-dependent receptor [Steroidobacteraceae bacterium]